MNSMLERLQKIEAYIPIDLLTVEGFLGAIAVLSFFIIFRYFLFVVPFYLFFWKANILKARKLHDQIINKKQINHEIKYSLLSTLIFALSGYVMGVTWQAGYSKIYLNFGKYGLPYFFGSFFIYALIHEFYFYFTHVWMHQPKLYKIIHKTHHISHKVSPWASFSFHPWECLVHALFLPLMILFIPIHPIVIISYLTFMTLTAVSNHSGVEIIKSSTLKKFFISGEHHFKHHHHFEGNYGLFFTFSDKLFSSEIGGKSKGIGDFIWHKKQS